MNKIALKGKGMHQLFDHLFHSFFLIFFGHSEGKSQQRTCCNCLPHLQKQAMTSKNSFTNLNESLISSQELFSAESFFANIYMQACIIFLKPFEFLFTQSLPKVELSKGSQKLILIP